MDRLISADALMREVETCISNNKQLIDEWFANVITDAIDEQPTVDAEPVRHGLWNPKITELWTMVFKCSECQENSNIRWAYCPYCGAKMDRDSNTHNTDSMR